MSSTLIVSWAWMSTNKGRSRCTWISFQYNQLRSACRVTVECGMRLSNLFKILETVSLSLDMFGRVPDVTICDAIAVGTFGTNCSLTSSLVSCDVLLANGKLTSWSWETNPYEMRALCCGLGMTAIIISATFQCTPIQRYCRYHKTVQFCLSPSVFPFRYSEISYLCSIRDVLDQWSVQLKSSFSQQLLWFPFSELSVMTHVNPTEKYQMVGKVEKDPRTCQQTSFRYSPSSPFSTTCLKRLANVVRLFFGGSDCSPADRFPWFPQCWEECNFSPNGRFPSIDQMFFIHFPDRGHLRMLTRAVVGFFRQTSCLKSSLPYLIGPCSIQEPRLHLSLSRPSRWTRAS